MNDVHVAPPAPPRWYESLFIAVGAPFTAVGRELRGDVALAFAALGAIFRGAAGRRAVVQQAYAVGNRSLFFITATLGFLGLISVYQVATQIQQILPDFSMLGAAFIQLMIREFAPTITGLMIATRVGSGIAAEIGSMVVTEQVDALRMCNADPVEYLVAPRVLGSVVMVPMLSIYAVLVATLAGMALGHAVFDIPTQTFLSLRLVKGPDIVLGLVKAVSYGFWIPIVAAHAGLSATGGSAGVGWATTRAVVATSFAVVLLDFVISGASYVIFSV
ncbi:MAG: ABC transporter permease [Myxococcales bacterium]|nr:ABC transporter permease [Myxococcales bacterium]MCB9733406.1 ABC transporter permease [Deltaproteobacteria bacterium]